MADNYREEISRIEAMAEVVDSYQESYDLLEPAKIELERLRTLNQEALIRVDVQRQLGDIAGRFTLSRVFNAANDVVQGNAMNAATNLGRAALAEIRSTTFARAVGPIEELPFNQLEDSIRRKIILSDTQVGAEQRLIAKYTQVIGNRYNKETPYEESIPSPSDSTYNSQLLNRAAAEQRSVINIPGPIGVPGAPPTIPVPKSGSTMIDPVTGKEKFIFNVYSKDNEFSRAKVLESFTYKDRAFPFRIQNMAKIGEERFETFPAYIESMNESVSTNWNSLDFINRSESIYVYQRAERSFTLDFFLFATNNTGATYVTKDEAERNIGHQLYTVNQSSTVESVSKEDMWRKIRFLHQCCRPEYTNNRFRKAPYCKLWLGDMFDGIDLIFDGVNLQYDPLIWDLNEDKIQGRKYGGIRPMYVKISLTGKFLHGVAPSSYSEFYKVESVTEG